MTTNNKPTNKPHNKAKRRKDLWMVEDVPAKDGTPPRTYWTRIGFAEENEDGSFSLTLAAVPVTGKMMMRDPAPVHPSRAFADGLVNGQKGGDA